MIAQGIILAYKKLRIGVPVVVRLRGTNEEVGRKMVRFFGFLPCLLKEGKLIMSARLLRVDYRYMRLMALKRRRGRRLSLRRQLIRSSIVSKKQNIHNTSVVWDFKGSLLPVPCFLCFACLCAD